MQEILNTASLLFIPIILTCIIGYGMLRRAPVYDYFIEGTRDGLKSAVEIMPFIISIFIGIEALVCSGAMDFIEGLVAPVFHFFKIPDELTSLILLRPVSGSGSLVVVEKILHSFGADSYVGRSASVMAGSCETIFYVLAIYFGVTSVKKMRHAFLAGIVGYITGIFASLIICMYI